MLKTLEKKFQKKKRNEAKKNRNEQNQKSSKNIDINFFIEKKLIYHVKNNHRRLCFSVNCEKIIFELIYD